MFVQWIENRWLVDIKKTDLLGKRRCLFRNGNLLQVKATSLVAQLLLPQYRPRDFPMYPNSQGNPDKTPLHSDNPSDP